MKGTFSEDGQTILVRIPMRLKTWDGKKALAEKEKFNDSYLSRLLHLTLLAPDIGKAILDGRQPETLTLADLMEPFPMVWREQREEWGFLELPIWPLCGPQETR